MAGRWQWTALLPLLALAACGSGQGSAERGPPSAASDPILAADSPVALTLVAQEGNAALIRGRLALEDGCLYLREQDGGRVLPTFPWPGTRWNPESGTLTIFGRQRYRLGDIVEAGGGFLSEDAAASDRDAIQRLLVAPRPACDTSRVAVLYFGPSNGTRL